MYMQGVCFNVLYKYPDLMTHLHDNDRNWFQEAYGVYVHAEYGQLLIYQISY